MPASAQSNDKPLRMSVEAFRVRQEAGGPPIVLDIRGPKDWDRSEGPRRPAGLSRDPDPSAPAQGSPHPGLLNLTAGSIQRPCGAPAPRAGFHGSLCPARRLRCLAIGRLPGRAERILPAPRRIAMPTHTLTP